MALYEWEHKASDVRGPEASQNKLPQDPLLVKEFLGHKKLDTTLLYIQIEQALFQETNDEFTVKVTRKPDEVEAVFEVGYGQVVS